VAAVPAPAAGHERCVLVPIKSFAAAKGRLSSVLGDHERRELVATMAANVLSASAPLPVWVACDDEEVAAFARAHGATVAWTPGLGLNGAVAATVALLAHEGAAFVTVVHADLPLASGIGALEHHDGVTIAPDRHGRGTNLLRVPTHGGVVPRFGRDSFRRHLEECARHDLVVTVLEREDLSFDVDVPEDLADLRRHDERWTRTDLRTRNGGTP
jgi:2-phospho-L-lactate/phosphoenolpyruvate guanylyltransferase